MSPVTTPSRELGRESLSDERERARRRLDDARRQEAQSAALFSAAQGTEAELGAYVQLRDAQEEVAARDRWLEWAESEDLTPPWPDFLPLHRLLG